MKLVENATLMEYDLQQQDNTNTVDDEKKTPVATLSRDADGRAVHPDISMASTTNAKGDSKVVATLKSYNSQSYTKLAQKIQRIETLEEEVKLLKAQVKTAAREDIADLFGADDIVSTRVVETVSFILTLSKNPKETETIKYASVIAELTKSLTPDLIVALDALKAKYTTFTQKEPSLKLQARESLGEGVWDQVKGVLALFKQAITSWASKFDSKLASLKAQVGVTESVDDDVDESIDYDRVGRIEKQVDYLIDQGRSREFIVDRITQKMGDEEGEHAGIYYDETIGDNDASMEYAQIERSTSDLPVFGHKYLGKKEIPVSEEADFDSEVTSSDIDTPEDQLMREYKETVGDMAFSIGDTVYCGSRSGVVKGTVPGKPNVLLVTRTNGEDDAFPMAQTSTKKPSLFRKAVQTVIGETDDTFGEVEEDLANMDALGRPDPFIRKPVEKRKVVRSFREWMSLTSNLPQAKISSTGNEVTASDFTGKRHMAAVWNPETNTGWIDSMFVKEDDELNTDDDIGLTE